MKSRLANRKKGKSIPRFESIWCSVGRMWSAYPEASINNTVAIFAPAMRLMVKVFICLIIVGCWHRRVSSSPPSLSCRIRSCESCREWRQSLPDSAICGHYSSYRPLLSPLVLHACWGCCSVPSADGAGQSCASDSQRIAVLCLCRS